MSSFNLAEWTKNLFKELENIRYCYFLAFLLIYFAINFVPNKFAEKLELFKYVNILSIIAIFSAVMLLGKVINSVSLVFEKRCQQKENLKYLKTLNPDEIRTLSLGVVCEQQTVYLNFQDSAGESLIHKGLIVKCEGKRDCEYTGPWPYVIPDFVWRKISKEEIFKKLTKQEILSQIKPRSSSQTIS